MQRQRCEQAAAAAGATVTEVFEDGGFSGSRADNRPALQRLLARLGEFDSVYVWKLDRLSRSARDYHNIAYLLQKCGTAFVSVSEGMGGSGAVGKMVLGQLAAVAEFFLDILKENVRAALDENARQGRHHGQLPFGYRRSVDKTVRIEPDTQQAPILRELFRRYANGESLSKLAAQLNTSPANSERRWTSALLGTMLRNRTYVGEIAWRGQVYEALHQPLIDWDTWSVVQKRLMENKSVPASARKRSLSPLFRCGVCGSCVRIVWGGPESRYRSYECHQRRTVPREQRHIGNSISILKAHALIWRAVEYFLGEEAIGQGCRKPNRRDRNAERRKLERERDRLDEHIAYNLEAGANNAVPLHILKRQNDPLMARLAETNRLLAQLDQAEEQLTELRATSPAQIVELLQSQDPEAQRRFAKAFFSVIELHDGFLRFVPTVPEVLPFDVAIPSGHPSRRREPVELRFLT
jgi:DNA invertase Pin-like site-specific DNA recombinase